jgi:hypothetical protein
MTATPAIATAQAATVVTPAARPAKADVRQKVLPASSSDFYQLADFLACVVTAEEKAIVERVRTDLESKAQPIMQMKCSDELLQPELERLKVPFGMILGGLLAALVISSTVVTLWTAG